jgi:Flp pilus assembly protein CpaB
VTILVMPDGAETLALAEHEGKIHLVLRNPDDQAEVTVASLSTREMLGHQPAVAAAPSRAPQRRVEYTPPVVAMKPHEKPKVRIIRSASVTESPAVTDSTAN